MKTIILGLGILLASVAQAQTVTEGPSTVASSANPAPQSMDVLDMRHGLKCRPSPHSCKFCAKLQNCASCVTDPDNCCYQRGRHVTRSGFQVEPEALFLIKKYCTHPIPMSRQKYIQNYCLRKTNPFIGHFAENDNETTAVPSMTGSVSQQLASASDASALNMISNDSTANPGSVSPQLATANDESSLEMTQNASTTGMPQSEATSELSQMTQNTSALSADSSTSPVDEPNTQMMTQNSSQPSEAQTEEITMMMNSSSPAAQVNESFDAAGITMNASDSTNGSSTQADASAETQEPSMNTLMSSTESSDMADPTGERSETQEMATNTSETVNASTEMATDNFMMPTEESSTSAIDESTGPSEMAQITSEAPMESSLEASSTEESQNASTSMGSTGESQMTMTTGDVTSESSITEVTTSSPTHVTDVQVTSTSVSANATPDASVPQTRGAEISTSTKTEPEVVISARCRQICPMSRKLTKCMECILDFRMCCFNTNTGDFAREKAHYLAAKSLCLH